MKRKLGVVSKEICKEWNIPEHEGKEIVIYIDRIDHARQKHLHEFSSEKEFNTVVRDLKRIISYPDFVYYDAQKKGLEYYKKLTPNNILVAVRVSSEKVFKVKSFYPVSPEKIANRMKKMDAQKLINKYSYKKIP